MTAEVVTIMSGMALLVVFALVGWNVSRRGGRPRKRKSGESRPGGD